MVIRPISVRFIWRQILNRCEGSFLDSMKHFRGFYRFVWLKVTNGILSQSLFFPIQSPWLFSLPIFRPEIFANSDE